MNEIILIQLGNYSKHLKERINDLEDEYRTCINDIKVLTRKLSETEEEE